MANINSRNYCKSQQSFDKLKENYNKQDISLELNQLIIGLTDSLLSRPIWRQRIMLWILEFAVLTYF